MKEKKIEELKAHEVYLLLPNEYPIKDEIQRLAAFRGFVGFIIQKSVEGLTVSNMNTDDITKIQCPAILIPLENIPVLYYLGAKLVTLGDVVKKWGEWCHEGNNTNGLGL